MGCGGWIFGVFVFIPGVGHVAVGGHLLFLLVSAGLGAAGGALGGALTSMGIPTYEADLRAATSSSSLAPRPAKLSGNASYWGTPPRPPPGDAGPKRGLRAAAGAAREAGQCPRLASARQVAREAALAASWIELSA